VRIGGFVGTGRRRLFPRPVGVESTAAAAAATASAPRTFRVSSHAEPLELGRQFRRSRSVPQPHVGSESGGRRRGDVAAEGQRAGREMVGAAGGMERERAMRGEGVEG
jgi:hypothetical protein